MKAGITRRLALLGCMIAVATTPCVAAMADVIGVPEVRQLDKKGAVEVRAQVVASDDEAPSHARARAMGFARQAAVEAVAGVSIKTHSLSFEKVRGSDAASLMQVLTSVRADALMVEEKLIHSRVELIEGGGYRVEVVLRGRVLDRSRSAKSGFETEIVLPATTFVDGEDLELKLRASRDARIYVIGVTDDGAAVLLPNVHMPDTRVRAGRWLAFPDEDLKARGVHLTAQMPPGVTSAHETLLVVALRGSRKLEGLRPTSGQHFKIVAAEGTGRRLADLLEPLLEIPAHDWSFDQVVYEVVQR